MKPALLGSCGAATLFALCLASPAPAQRVFGGAGEDIPLLKEYDKDGDGILNAAERAAARQAAMRRSRRSRFGRRAFWETPEPGPKLTAAEVQAYSAEQPLYDLKVLRTLFLDFEDQDWEQEMADFYGTDVDVPATLTVDGNQYAGVGVHFRGNTSYSNVSEGYKRSLHVSWNMVHKSQRLYGYRTLNLLNSAADPTFLRSVLYMQISRDYFPAPKANYVRVVINGESWGIYVNVQQFNSDFTAEAFNSAKGARWKTPGSPGARSGLAYFGDEPDSYKWTYEIKTKDDPKSWEELIHFCKVLNETPPAELEKALEPLLDIDGTLRWLAVDKALINNDGYWTRASDYSIFEDEHGRFHVFPQDSNETLRPTETFGRYAGGGGAINLDPYAGANDPNKALLYRLLAVPALHKKYLGYLRDIAEHWLVWDRIGPMAEQYQALIAADVEADTRKLATTKEFKEGVTEDHPDWGGGPISPPGMSLKTFVQRRHDYLLNYPDIKNLDSPPGEIH